MARRSRCGHVDRPVLDGIAAAMKADIDMLAASVSVDDVKALYLEFEAAGVAFHQALREEPWGARTFIVKDRDGNLLLFAEAPNSYSRQPISAVTGR
jgi:uncharacterized glyoxalase superfamily protein PhnB